MAEFAIPFKSLSFPAGRTVWGFNVARNIYRKLEDDRWSGARLETQFCRCRKRGRSRTSTGLTQGIGLDVRPFLAGRWLHVGGRGRRRERKPGLDLFYNITPSLKLTATFNTDFGETEVDARQINLSRFSLLFPEKRSFFLEGAGVFNFASTGPEPAGGIPATGADVYPFFSRQIGLLGGQEVPHRRGRQADRHGRPNRRRRARRPHRRCPRGQLEIVDEKNFFVGRIKRNLFQQSYIGAIFTTAIPPTDQSGQTYGADMRLATSRFLGRLPQLRRQRRTASRSVNARASDAAKRLVVRLLGALSERQVRRAGRVSRDSGELQARARLRPARQRPAAPGGRQLQPAAEGLPEHPADVPRRVLHAVHAAGQRPGRELGPVRHAARLALQVRRQHPRHARLQPDLRAAVRAVRDLARRRSCRRASTASRASGAICSRRPRSAGSRAAST